MKMTKRKVFVAALAVCLVAIISTSSLAWLTAEDYVNNKFMIATSEDTNPNDIFSVDVWEKTPDSDKEQDGHEYKDILPGDDLTKEVNVENTGYYDQYVRVTVTVSDAAAWQGALNTTETPALDDIVKGYDATKWAGVTSEIVGDDIVYTLYYNGILDGDDAVAPEGTKTVTVFESVKIPESMTVEQAAAFQSSFEISVKAEAIQSGNTGDNAQSAFATYWN